MDPLFSGEICCRLSLSLDLRNSFKNIGHILLFHKFLKLTFIIINVQIDVMKPSII